jgi:hypothetical protein
VDVEPSRELVVACRSGLDGGGSGLNSDGTKRRYLLFKNGHMEYISPRENELVLAAYQQGREHAAMQSPT